MQAKILHSGFLGFQISGLKSSEGHLLLLTRPSFPKQNYHFPKNQKKNNLETQQTQQRHIKPYMQTKMFHHLAEEDAEEERAGCVTLIEVWFCCCCLNSYRFASI